MPGDPCASDTDDDHRIDFERAPNEFFRGFIEIVNLRNSSSENENDDKESEPDKSSELIRLNFLMLIDSVSEF